MWLLDPNTVQAMRSAPAITAEQQDAYALQIAANEESPLQIAGDTGRINIIGTMTDAPSFMARYFGGGNTVYSDIVRAVAEAEANPQIKSIEYYIASGGGQASAEWLAAMNAIRDAEKPSRAFVGSMAASAAYGVASQADEIVAQNAMSYIGSVGTVVDAVVREDVVSVTSSNAPNKRPDIQTPEGQATIRTMLDQVEGQFIDAIAEGRGVTADDVRKNYGRGATMTAAEAMKKGMIDSIQVVESKTTATTGGKPTTGASTMDITKLKAEHPAVFAEAVRAGVTQERERVEAHLTLAKASGAHDVAIEAIENGDELTSKYQAKYMAASMDQNRINAQAADDTAATDAATQAAAADGPDLEDQTAEIVAAQMGVEHNA